MENIKLPFACSECIVQITRQNQVQAGLFVPEQRCLRMACQFSLMHVLQNLRSRDDPTGLTHERTRLDFIIFEQAIYIALISELGAVQCNFLTWFICILLKMYNGCIYAHMLLQQLGCWYRLKQLAVMFLNTFYRKMTRYKSIAKERS